MVRFLGLVLQKRSVPGCTSLAADTVSDTPVCAEPTSRQRDGCGGEAAGTGCRCPGAAGMGCGTAAPGRDGGTSTSTSTSTGTGTCGAMRGSAAIPALIQQIVGAASARFLAKVSHGKSGHIHLGVTLLKLTYVEYVYFKNYSVFFSLILAPTAKDLIKDLALINLD